MNLADLSHIIVDMEDEEALEFFEFNILGGWHGEGTPCFIFTDEREDLLSN